MQKSQFDLSEEEYYRQTSQPKQQYRCDGCHNPFKLENLTLVNFCGENLALCKSCEDTILSARRYFDD